MTQTAEPTTTAEPKKGNWGRWGDDDERGALNLLDDAAVLAATRECRTGKVYSLGLPLQREGVPWFDYRGAPQRLTLTSNTDGPMYEGFGASPGVGANEDVLVLASHSVTHMDALCHVFAEGTIYNGFPADSFRSNSGAGRCGIEKVRGFAGRAVLLDLPRHFGVDWLDVGGQVITGADLDACASAEGVTVRAGDVLLVRTGYLDFFQSQAAGAAAGYGQPGLGYDAAAWVLDHDLAAVGADNAAVEAIPFDRGVFLGVHIELLVKGGVPLLEHIKLAEMAADGCHTALLVVAPLLVTGATGSPINPIAIG